MALSKSSMVAFIGTLIVVASAGVSFVAVTGIAEPRQVVAQAALAPSATPRIEISKPPKPLPIRERIEEPETPPPPAATPPRETPPPPVRESREPTPPAPPARDRREPEPRADPDVADPPPPAPRERRRDFSLRTPYGDVDVRGDRDRVRVRAPYAAVDVDRDGGRVRVRAPYVDLDIRW